MEVQNWSKMAIDREAGPSLFRQFYVILYVIDKCMDLARYFFNFLKHFLESLVNRHELYLQKF